MYAESLRLVGGYSLLTFFFFVLQDALQEIIGLARELPKKKIENPNGGDL